MGLYFIDVVKKIVGSIGKRIKAFKIDDLSIYSFSCFVDCWSYNIDEKY